MTNSLPLPNKHRAGEIRETTREPGLTRAQADAMLASRMRSLASLERSISASLREAIEEKLRFEHAALAKLADADAAAREARARSAQILKPAYFAKKPLEIVL